MNKINLVKPVLRLYRPDESEKLCSFCVPKNKAGEIFVNVKPGSFSNSYRFIIELRNKLGKLLGHECYSHFNNTDSMTGLYIEVLPEYRQKNYFFGEILRLASIIQMMENKVRTFSIKSKDTAIYFHSKYKFEPSVTSFKDRDELLKTLAEDTSDDFQGLAVQAKDLIGQINSPSSAEAQRTMCKQANELLKRYIKKATAKQDIKHKFNWSMDMTLKDKTIMENKDYFNALFVKHGIDYKI